MLKQSLSWQHCFVHISYSNTSYVVSSDVSCMLSCRILWTIAIQLNLELTCVRWPLLELLLVMLNCPLVLGDMTDSPSGPWIRSIVSSATYSDADSASAYFSSSNFFELIIRIVLWRHAMCSVTHDLCCRQGGERPYLLMCKYARGKACFQFSAFIQRRSMYAACST